MLEIARAQKQLLWMVLANIGTGILFMAVTTNWRGAPTSIAILIPAYLILLASTGLQIFFLVRLMLAMRFHIAAVVLLPILMLISCIGLIVLLVINQTATSRLQRGGIRVGFMGAEIPAGPPMPIGQLPITPRPLPTPPGPPQ
jgi:hypothetical protein